MTCNCGCCQGIHVDTPAHVYNPPGRGSIDYRIGTHGAFRETMQARLSSQDALRRLTTRDSDDPSIAMLDCFAVVGDILTFYQERIANEGYLRTATEATSLTELAALVGYRPRPALGSTTVLAYTLAPDATTLIPAGSGARSVPRQDELPQTFETSEDLDARQEWNTLAPAITAPPSITYNPREAAGPANDARMIPHLTVAGTAANLKTGDRLLFVFGADSQTTVVRTVADAAADFQAGTTSVSLVPPSDAWFEALTALLAAVQDARETVPAADFATNVDTEYLDGLEDNVDPSKDPDVAELLMTLLGVVDRLSESAALAAVSQPRAVMHWFESDVRNVITAARRAIEVAELLLGQAPATILAVQKLASDKLCPQSDLEDEDEETECDKNAAAALIGLTPMLPWLRRPPSHPPRKPRDAAPDVAQLFRPDSDVHAKLLAAADPRLAPVLHIAMANGQLANPPTLSDVQVMRTKATIPQASDAGAAGGTTLVELDTVYDGIVKGTKVIIGDGIVCTLEDVSQGIRTEVIGEDEVEIYIPCTELTVDVEIEYEQGDPVYAQGESLTVVGEPILDDIEGDKIELARVYDGLRPGRLLVVAGERTDVPFTSGIHSAELTMVAGVKQRIDPKEPGSSVRTFLQLAVPLAYRYRRDTVSLYGNVVEASQGETRRETLGSGDASLPNQVFRIRQTDADHPLTFLPAVTPSGAEDTLDVAVSEIRWQSTEVLAAAAVTDRVYGTAIGADQSVRVQFGDGVHGARAQTGTDNVTAKLRVGAGSGGNVVATQISQLTSQPLGVTAVTNPLPATGGAGGDGPGDVRACAPLRMLALDRLVSVRDYEDFTRARAGIGKASARKLLDEQRRHVVHVTVAGIGDVPVDPLSGLLTTLHDSLIAFGNVGVPVRVDVRELILLVLSAGIKVSPDREWDLVEPAVRSALIDTFSFTRRELGQDAYLSEALAAMQAVPGVDYVDVDVFDGVDGTSTPLDLITLADRLDVASHVVRARTAEFDEESVMVRVDETLTEFALRVGVTVEELCVLNPTLPTIDLEDYQQLVVRRGILPAQIALLPADVPEALTLRRIR